MDFETVVIGAGVVGLAIAAELSSSGPVVVLERREKYGQETSSHNSEVLHAGLYYPIGSLKARLCLEGNLLLRRLSADKGIPLQLIGKLVVGNTNEEEAILALAKRARANGVRGPRLLSQREIAQLEPNIISTHALYSPTTGILDSHALMRYFLTQAIDQGAELVCHTEVIGLEPTSGGFRVHTRDGDGNIFSVSSSRVINAAGLGSDRIASMAGIDIDQAGYRLHPCKGDYFSTPPRCWKLASHLLYPAPVQNAAGLGIHVTLDLGGRIRLGPDSSYVARRDSDLEKKTSEGETIALERLEVDPTKAVDFAHAVQRYLPGILVEDLSPEMSGIRPKLQGPDEAPRDFAIQEESARGLPGLVNLIGIESPGLTASPAIAREVKRLLEG